MIAIKILILMQISMPITLLIIFISLQTIFVKRRINDSEF